MGNKPRVYSKALIQKSIPYLRCFEEAGMIETEEGVFSRSYRILQPGEGMKQGFSAKQTRAAMEDILRKLSGRFSFQFTVRNARIGQEEYLEGVELAASGGADEYRGIRESYNAVIRENYGIGHNNSSRTVCLTLSTRADAPEFGSRVDYDGKGFSIRSMQRMKATTKEVIAPDRYGCVGRDCLQIGNSFVRVFFINSLPASVPDSLLGDLASVSSNSILSVSYEPMDAVFGLDVAAGMVRRNTSVREIPVRETVADRKENRTRRQEETIRETEEEYFYKSALGLFKQARAREEPALQASFVIALYAAQPDELDRDSRLLELSAAKYACQVRCLELQQDEGFQSALPLNNMRVNVKRVFTVGQLAVLQPLDIQGAFERVRTFYGLNAIDDNLVFLDRGNYVTAMIAGMGHKCEGQQPCFYGGGVDRTGIVYCKPDQCAV